VTVTVNGRVVVFKRDNKRNFPGACGTVLTGGPNLVSSHALSPNPNHHRHSSLAPPPSL
jgi:hypothetical protein